MTPRQARMETLRYSMEQIKLAFEHGRAEGFRICSTKDPADANAQYWGVDKRGEHRFGTHRDLLIMVAFPAKKLAERCLDMTGGYVIPVADILNMQHRKMEEQLNKLQSMESIE